MKTLRFALICVTLMVTLAITAQAPKGYYASADGKKAAALKTALCGIINPHNNIGYDGLWTAYRQTDVRPDGKVWDMYSNTTSYTFGVKQGSNYSKEGDAYNREHSVPQSWFSEAAPMKADIFHVYPTDGYVNNRRSNYPFGEVKNPTYTSNGGFCKLGPCATEGYSGTVFEPADEYKGDFARTYFYMATCYENNISSWSGEVFGRGKYPGMADWCVKMFLRWAKEDPVSQKEIDRNNAAYGIQNNRNPYIDFPGLEQYVWGAYTAEAFSSTDYVAPDPSVGPTPPPGPDPDPDPEPSPNPGIGTQEENEYALVTAASQLVDGAPVLIVCTEEGVAMAASNGTSRTKVNVKPEAFTITTETGSGNNPYAFLVGVTGRGFTFFDTTELTYLSLEGNKNSINSQAEVDDNALWDVTIATDGTATIQSQAHDAYSIQYNTNASMFRCYKSGQASVQIYQGAAPAPDGVGTVLAPTTAQTYNLQGQPLQPRRAPRGLHVRNGRVIIAQ